MNKNNLRPWLANRHRITRVILLTLVLPPVVIYALVAEIWEHRSEFADLYRDAWNK